MTFQTYITGIPATANNPSVDQPNMLTNTNNIPPLIAQDHFGFNDNAGGNHKQVHMKNQAAPGGIGANADGVFYCNSSAGQSRPFWQNAAAGSPFQFSLLGAQSIATNGYLTLVGGIILQWGFVNAPGGGPTAVTFPLNPFPNNVFSVQLTPRNDGGHSAFTYYLDGAPTTAGFTYRGSTTGSQTLFWFAIGN